MPLFRVACRVSLAVAFFAVASPAIARHPNVSDITGPNVSDITGPNVSDITGPNTSDITGPNTSDITGTTAYARAQRALRAGMNQESLDKLAAEIGLAYDVCASGGDCANFYTLYEQSRGILFD